MVESGRFELMEASFTVGLGAVPHGVTRSKFLI
jgi:hypothetical protein